MRSRKRTKENKPPLRKNVSQSIRNGTAIQTRDEFLEDGNGYTKPSHKNDNVLYRELLTIETNRRGEVVVVKVQSGGKEEVINKSGQKEKYNLYFKSKDSDGNPITLGKNFKRANPKYDISKKDANEIKKKAIKSSSSKVRKDNRNKLRELKGRKKRKP